MGERIGGPVRPVRAPATSTGPLAQDALDRAAPEPRATADASRQGRHAARGHRRAGQTVAAHALPPQVPQHHGARAPRPACGRAAPAEQPGGARAPARRSPGAAERRGRHSGAGLGDRADFIEISRGGPAGEGEGATQCAVRPGERPSGAPGRPGVRTRHARRRPEDTVTPAREQAARALAVAFLGEPAPAGTERTVRGTPPRHRTSPTTSWR